MKDQSKTKQALIQELASLRQRIQELEYSESERKRAKDALRESEEKYRAIIENMQEGYHEVDLKGNFTFFNESTCKILGYEKEDLLGMNNRQYSDEENARKVYQVYNRVYRTGEPVKNFEWQIIRKDGDRRDVEVSILLVRDAGGHPTGFRGIVRDTTERKRADNELRSAYEQLRAADEQMQAQYKSLAESERSLRESEERFKTLFEKSTDAQILLDHEGKMVDCNDAHVKLLGLQEKSEILGHTPVDFAPEFQFNGTPSSEMGKKIRTTTLEKGSVRFEWLHEKHDPAHTPIVTELSCTLIHIANRPMIHVVIQDITAHKQAEEALRENEKKYRTMIETTGTGFVIIDQDGLVLDANQEYVRLTGHHNLSEIVGRSVMEWTADYEKEKNVAAVEECLKKGYIRNLEIDYVDSKASITPIEINATCIESGGKAQILTLCRDITDRKQAEKTLQRSEEKFFKIFQASPNLMAIRSLKDGRFIDVNDAYIDVTGYSREELLGADSGTLGITYSENVERAREIINKQGFIRNWEGKFKTKAGDVRTGLFSAVVTEIEDEPCLLSALQDITERKQAEEAILQAKEEWERTFYAVPDLIAILDTEYRIVRANRAMASRLGMTPEECVGLTCYRTIHGMTEPPVFCPHRTLLEDGSEHSVEVHEDRLGGDYFVSVSPLYDPRGKLMGSIHVARDITNSKKAEEALRESEKNYRNIFENAVMGIFHTTPEGRYLRANPAGARMYGYESAEDIIQSVTDMSQQIYANPEDRAKFKEIMERTGRIEGFESEHYRKDGSKIWTVLSSRAVRDNAGRTLYYETTIEDVTERKKMEGKLLAEGERLASILDGTPVPAFVIDRGRNVILWNKSNETYTGRTREEMLGKRLDLSFLHKGKARPTLAALMLEMTDDQIIKRFAHKGARSSEILAGALEVVGNIWLRGEERIMSIQARRIYGTKGEIIGVIQTGQDITERIRLEAQFRQAQKMEAIGTLAGGIAHDFNNILSAILGYSDMALTDRKADDPHRHYLEQIYKAGERARDLVKQILTFSRQQEQEKKPVLIVPIIKEGIKLLRSSLPTTVKISQNIKDTSIMVLADPTQIHQVLMNLCTNAAHAMREKGGTLNIQLVREVIDSVGTSQPLNFTAGNYAKLTVSDTGHGIDSSIIDRIFDPFFTTKGPQEGTGLGLSVVYGIVRHHGGTIDVSSEPGRGTTVTVYFPLIQAEKPIEERMPEAIPGGSERILFIDDEAMLVELGSTMLTSLGYQVTPRTSSIEALEAFRANPYGFDMVITDMTMPNIRGDDLAKELLKIRPGIPIIICTGFSEMISEDKAKNIGIHEFIMKPIIKNQIARAIKQALDYKE
jgi:two-component system, cell cycle sensor histidine kinase and response regulator CckA